MTGRQVLLQLILGPVTDSGISVAAEIIGAPAFGHPATEFLPVVQSLQQISGCVTVATMTQGLDQIRSAVPIRRTIGYRLKTSVRVVEQRPYRHQRSLVVGESQRVRRRDVAHCRHTEA